MLTVLTLLKLKPSPNGEQHGERPFWREYGVRYLDKWLASVEAHVPQPHRVVVMTDASAYLWAQVPHAWTIDRRADLDGRVDAPGFWAKTEMFRHGTGKCLYCDLDNVINGPLDELCALEPGPLIMLDDRRVPGLPNGSMILFDADKCRWIWTEYVRNKALVERTFVAAGDDYWRAYDQAYIAECVRDMRSAQRVPMFQDFLPDGYILNARTELPDAAHWQDARVIFGGGAEGKPHVSTHPGFSLRA